MTKEAFVNISGRLMDLAPDSWFTDREKSSFWLRIYTSLFIPHAEFKYALNQLFSGIKKDEKIIHQVKYILFGGGLVKDMKVPCFSFYIYSQESGQLVLETKVDDRTLKETNYIFIAVPFKVDGVLGDESLTRKKLDSVASLIRIYTGQNFMREIVFEGEIDAATGNFSTSSKPIKMPQIVEGPFLAKQNGISIKEISEKISTLPEDKKRRIELALQFMNDAMDKDSGFFEYWTALEIVCNGKSGKIKRRLADIYKITSHNDAAKKTGFKKIAEWRHDFIHKGIRPTISADVERYIQLLFLDLLRHEIGLPCEGHIVSIQQAQGYNLTPLGLKDNRTKEQKELSERQQSK